MFAFRDTWILSGSELWDGCAEKCPCLNHVEIIDVLYSGESLEYVQKVNHKP